ncbi:MAG: dTMP kinase [Gaiellaceae bacterium]
MSAAAPGAAQLVDAASAGSVLVFGSLPPEGRDLDLLVRPAAEAAAAHALASAGFLHHGVEWIRFRPWPPEVVDLVPASAWGLPAAELDSLFAEALPVEPFSTLVRPAPHHALLVLARLAAGGGLSPGRRRRVEAALAESATAWDDAARRAGRWGASAKLEALRAAYEERGAPERGLARRGPRVLRRLRRPAVVALSGIDGSGKSTQSAAVVEALALLGHDAVVEWIPLGSNEWLDRLATPAKRLLARRGFQPPPRREGEPRSGKDRNPGTVLRQRNAAVNEAWASLVAVANGVAHRRQVLRHAARGRVVVFDRYVLDSAVRLRFLYGEPRRFRAQAFVVRLLSPRPVVAFFLALDPDDSLARKDDRWSPGDLASQARLYEEEWERHGAVRLDARRHPEDLAAEVAERVWRALRGA